MPWSLGARTGLELPMVSPRPSVTEHTGSQCSQSPRGADPTIWLHPHRKAEHSWLRVLTTMGRKWRNVGTSQEAAASPFLLYSQFPTAPRSYFYACPTPHAETPRAPLPHRAKASTEVALPQWKPHRVPKEWARPSLHTTGNPIWHHGISSAFADDLLGVMDLAPL